MESVPGEWPEGWQVAVAIDDIPASGLSEVIFGQRHVVLIVRTGGDFVAVQGLCPHQMARLGHGTLLDDGRLQCPHHLAKFSLVDGTCDSGWVLPPLKRYATLVRNGHVLVPDPLVPLD